MYQIATGQNETSSFKNLNLSTCPKCLAVKFKGKWKRAVIHFSQIVKIKVIYNPAKFVRTEF